MKKTIIITLAVVGIVVGYILLKPTDEVKVSVPDVSDKAKNTEESVPYNNIQSVKVGIRNRN